ncbi:NAD(P)-binding domain-containing protein [Halomonas janggokensis]|uniref:NAD(P)-binding domain-containing protein n=1 Tax=Vreelandella janggokensis TaxID=370767 RepID=A0ABT4IU84_9GAMM|nr:NAD(P)/FAD-dependent oxidoreductase [Halomonas janggokensis]MCZ0927220.1 NAD(P)-binding domain-containing protein [Halomonas janggokensis]MCZ0929728.1 NAD(P)-binding domain-containing protein [Halomonas janggokensis]
MQYYDVIIVGAGPAGVGLATLLAKLPDLDYVLLEGGRIGESLRRWPAQTRFITPSFYSNPFGLADLNAVDASSSPALYCGVEHPSGTQYADYLRFVAQQHELPIREDWLVQQVATAADGGFVVSGEQGELHTRFLVWATGEYQFPALSPFPGASWCPHYAEVENWADFTDSRYTVIGGYESGVDAAVNLVQQGRSVRLLARKSSWDPDSPHDPSLSLSPYTRGRLEAAVSTGRLEIVFGADIVEVVANADGGFSIHAADGRQWACEQPPILGTGFLSGGGATQIDEWWEWDAKGQVLLTEMDESTRVPGLFLVGPQVRHDPQIYCFIYKFRQRFAMIATCLAERLDIDTWVLDEDNQVWGAFGNQACCEDCQC